MMRALAIVLLLVGTLTLSYPSLTYTTEESVLDVGGVTVTAEERQRVPLAPVAGGVAAAAGLFLLFRGRIRQ